jgi:hypothetical protein
MTDRPRSRETSDDGGTDYEREPARRIGAPAARPLTRTDPNLRRLAIGAMRRTVRAA